MNILQISALLLDLCSEINLHIVLSCDIIQLFVDFFQLPHLLLKSPPSPVSTFLLIHLPNMYIYPSFQSQVTFEAVLFTLLLYILGKCTLIHRVLNVTSLFFYSSYCRFLDITYQTRCVSKATFILTALSVSNIVSNF